MAALTLMAVLALSASAGLAQQYSGNYVDAGDYDYQDQGGAPAPALPPARPAPAPIQRSIRPSPPQQGLRSAGPATVRTPPVAILKQINRHNDDGSYTYGFEGADGSFKIETKLPTGEVMGKYGYVDDTGKVRTVEYGANKFGFQPVGEGITVAPPTYVDETRKAKGDRDLPPDYDDGQYYEELPAPAPAPRPRVQPQLHKARPAPRPKAAQVSYQQQPLPQGQVIYQQQPQPQPQPQPHLSHAPVPRVSQGFGPEPPRAQIAGAAPVPSEPLYRPQPPPHRSFPSQSTQARFLPSPPPQRSFPQPVARAFPSQPAPVHQFEHAAPAPAPAPAHHFAPRPSPQGRQGGGSYFDQLTKDYALPTGGNSNPIHDIAFGVQY